MLEVHGGVDVQAAVVDLVLAETVDEFPAHLFEVKRGHFPGRVGHAFEHQRLGHGGVVLGLGDPALDEHAPKDVFLAGLGGFEITERGIAAGGLGQAGQERGLGDGQVGHVDAEIGPCRRFHAIRPGTQVDLV